MLADDLLDREDAAATVLPGTRAGAHLGQRPGTVLERGGEVAVGDDAAVADDHIGKATLNDAVR